MGKKIILVLLCVVLMMSLAVPALAAQPRFSYILSGDTNINISSGRAEVSAWAEGYPSTTKMTIAAALQQYKNGSWVTVATYPTASGTVSASLSKTTAVKAGYGYRVKATVTAYSGSAKETQILYSSEVDY